MASIWFNIHHSTPRQGSDFRSAASRALALQISGDLAQMRWILIEQREKSLPPTFVVVLVFWLAMLFASFGMFAPRNATVITVLGISALSVAGALFIIMEMNTPLEGMIKVSSAPPAQGH